MVLKRRSALKITISSQNCNSMAEGFCLGPVDAVNWCIPGSLEFWLHRFHRKRHGHSHRNDPSSWYLLKATCITNTSQFSMVVRVYISKQLTNLTNYQLQTCKSDRWSHKFALPMAYRQQALSENQPFVAATGNRPSAATADIPQSDIGCPNLSGVMSCLICQKIVKGGLNALKAHQSSSSRCLFAQGLGPAQSPCPKCKKLLAGNDRWALQQHQQFCPGNSPREPPSSSGRGWHTSKAGRPERWRSPRRKAKTEEQDGHSKNWNHGRHGHDRDDDNGHYDNGDIHEYEADDNHHPNYHDQSTSEHTWGFSAWQRCWRITSQRDATNALQDWSESGAWSRHDWHWLMPTTLPRQARTEYKVPQCQCIQPWICMTIDTWSTNKLRESI